MRLRRTATAVVLAVTALGAATACSSSSKTGKVLSSAGSAAASAAASAGSAAASAAKSAGGNALASASAALSSAMASATSGIDVKNDVTASQPTATSGEKVSSDIRAANTSSKTASFTIVVSFRDASGNVLDTTTVSIKDVAAGQHGTATATSHRKLGGTVKVQIDSAVRH